ncbi:MAG: hypothetical protein EOP41_10275, partial [Sphingobacteriaceae bacterium]
MITPSSLLVALAECDSRMCWAYNRSSEQFIYSNPAFDSFFGAFGPKFLMKELFALINKDDRAYLLSSYAAMSSGVFSNSLDFRI